MDDNCACENSVFVFDIGAFENELEDEDDDDEIGAHPTRTTRLPGLYHLRRGR